MTGHNVVKHDYLSFTWSPEPVKRLSELAKQGAILKAIPRINSLELSMLSTIRPMPGAGEGMLYTRSVPGFQDEQVSQDTIDELRGVLTATHYSTMAHLIKSHYRHDANKHVGREAKALLTGLMDASEFLINPDATYWDAYNDLVWTYGVQWLDCLCLNELDLFLEELNHQIGVPLPAPRFTLRQRKTGMHGYSHSADIICDGIAVCGLVAWGALNHGVLVSFSGTGCDALDIPALYRVLVNVPGVRLTRVDLALDDYTGSSITYLRAVEALHQGGFMPSRGASPAWMTIQSGEVVPELSTAIARRYGMVATRGCSLYVGSRKNGKCCRIYEKGLQMESKEFPQWVRAEGELHNKDRVIPLDVLVKPDDYFAGMYPQFAVWLAAVSAQEVKPNPIRTFKNRFFTCRDNAVENMSRLAGRMVNWLKEVEQMTPDAIVNMLTAHLEPYDLPQRLKIPVPHELYIESA